MHFFTALTILLGLSIVSAEVNFPDHTVCTLQYADSIVWGTITKTFYHDNYINIIHSGLKVQISYTGPGSYYGTCFKSLYTEPPDSHGKYRSQFLYWGITHFGEYYYIKMTTERVSLLMTGSQPLATCAD